MIAQFTITSDNLIVAGDRLSQVKADTTAILPGAKGDNTNWSFTLNLSSDTIYTYYVGVNTTPVADAFPTANLASFITLKNLNVYTYYQMLPNEIVYLGTANYSKSYIFSIPFQNPKVMFEYPFVYRDTLNRDYSFYLESAGAQNFYYGNILIDYDSFGKLKLNDKEFDCIRLHTTDLYGSSKIFKESEYSSYIETYDWYIKEYKFPVFTIKYSRRKSKDKTVNTKEVLVTIVN